MGLQVFIIRIRNAVFFFKFQISKRLKITIELLEGFLDVAAVLETGVEVVNVETGGGRHFTPRHRVPEQHQIYHKWPNTFFQLL